MSDRFLAQEIFSNTIIASIPNKLIFPATSTIRYYKVELVRLLIGISSFKCQLDGKIINQRNNHLRLPYQYNKNLNPKIGRYFQVDTLLLEKKLANQSNRGFYDEILTEFYSYFYESAKDNQTIAFLHLYRIIERIAIALPLVYAACSTDYKGIYNEFKRYILDDKTGELKVLTKFLSSFIDSTNLNQNVDINFEPLINQWHEKHFIALKKFSLEESSTPYSTLTYKYKNIIELTIKTRNSYFHALTGANNSFSSSEVIHSNEFFKTINPTICNWLSFITLQIIKFELTNS